MKKIGFYNYYDTYNNNRLFSPDYKSSIGDDLSYPFRYLAEEAKRQGILVSTIDMEPLDNYDVIIFLDYPTQNNIYFQELKKKKSEKTILFVLENELIRPDNWDINNYRDFNKVYTWHDKIVDNKKVKKLFLPNNIPDSIPCDDVTKKKFCCLIASNKLIRHKLELYSERIQAIRWFEKNDPQLFDLYGQGWNEYPYSGKFGLKNRFSKIINRYSPVYPSYRGPIQSKFDILRQYKFSICYENARDIPGYITEKIFDSFFAGCIPVYWGAPNITQYIPENTFIDRRKFKTYNELVRYLINMSNSEYYEYLNCIEKFIHSSEINNFSVEHFADMILNLVQGSSGEKG